MALLSYSAITSLDGYVADASGNFDWAAPDQEVHAFVNELERPIGTYLYGRRMFQVMSAWDSREVAAGGPALVRDFADLWQAANKVVYSTTLDTVTTGRTRLERTFDPGVVRELKESLAEDLSVGGPELAAHAIRAGLVDEFHQFLHPVVVGGGQPWLPDEVRVELELLEYRGFDCGVVYLRYRRRC